VVSFLLVAATLLGSGCASFNHEWKQVGQYPTPSNTIEGRWQGVWVSAVSGHTDALRCVITRTEVGGYRARFHAKYRKVLSFGYTVPLTVASTNLQYAFHGEANLGWMAGGLYHYEGLANATSFHSTYSCKYDHGTFQMTRP
jgi:hypothetical protein